MAEPIKFLRLLKGPFVVGGRICERGDVVPVRGMFDRERSLLPVVPRVDQYRARQLVDAKVATPDPGPERYGSPDEDSPVERAVNPPRAERAQLRR